MKLSLIQAKCLQFASLNPDNGERRAVNFRTTDATWNALKRRGLVKLPGKFGKCWSITPAGEAELHKYICSTCSGSGINSPFEGHEVTCRGCHGHRVVLP